MSDRTWIIREVDGATARDLEVTADDWTVALRSAWLRWRLGHDLRRAGIETRGELVTVFIRGTQLRYLVVAAAHATALEARARSSQAPALPSASPATSPDAAQTAATSRPTRPPRPAERSSSVPPAATADAHRTAPNTAEERIEDATTTADAHRTAPSTAEERTEAAAATAGARRAAEERTVPPSAEERGGPVWSPEQSGILHLDDAHHSPTASPVTLEPPSIPELPAARLQQLSAHAAVVFEHTHRPSERAPVLYVRHGCALPLGTEPEEAAAFARALLSQLKRRFPRQSGEPPRLFHVAIYDEFFSGDAQVEPLCRLEWKEWKNQIRLAYPQRGDLSVQFSSSVPQMSAPPAAGEPFDGLDHAALRAPRVPQFGERPAERSGHPAAATLDPSLFLGPATSPGASQFPKATGTDRRE